MPDQLHPKLRDLAILYEVHAQLLVLATELSRGARSWAAVRAETDRIQDRIDVLEKRIENGS